MAVPFNIELNDLSQKPDESIASYYKRTTGLMQRVGARDRPTNGAYSMMETAILDSVVRAFVKGLHDPEVRRETYKGLEVAQFSLKGVYVQAEEARRTRDEIRKLVSEETKNQELSFLRSLIGQLPPYQVEAMKTAYSANPASLLELASIVRAQ